MNVVLISTYELGHQPFGLASPAAWLRARGAQVTCLDLSRQQLEGPALAAVSEAALIAFYVPMHTATRLAAQLLNTVSKINPHAHLCFYGLYAPVNEDYLRGLGVQTILGGEFEGGLADLYASLAGQQGTGVSGMASAHTDAENARENGTNPQASATSRNESQGAISLERLNFLVPDRSGLPALSKYAHVLMPDGASRVAGYTEASRGCKHLCRHCPIVPVYNGAFRIVQREVVLEDIRQQVAAGAQHISFGDPDFFNGPTHALAIVEALHAEFPQLSYDVTIKIEHLLNHAEHLPRLRDTGCLFVTTAVESVDDEILERLDKGHTRADFLAVALNFRKLGMVLHPTFVPFTPWTTLEGYGDLLTVLAEQELIENVAPIQLGIRLLIPAGSRLLELDELRDNIGVFNSAALVYPWRHADPRMDRLAERVQDLAAAADKAELSRAEAFVTIWQATADLTKDVAKGATKDAVKEGASVAQVLGAHAMPVSGKTKSAPEPEACSPRSAVIREIVPLGPPPALTARAAIPHLSEAWYCCAEPTRDQFVAIAGAALALPLVQPTPKPKPAEQSALAVQPDAFI